ncbi:hypothetical protein CHS0354_035079 [Potamilus streckersoni]|uniref:Chitin-binding type-4 domain-containing protein n=1 Tax=Potamilus streckersoni TaxID=2493646 RepID=A0AAE0RY74_9BIVA|nr:hypothetical protein CHS0354_035079 [Potamilus streckersoni]
MQPYIIFCLTFLDLIPQISAHGRLIEPPSRSSMWRVGYLTAKNYNDNQLFCGGREVQWNTNGGKCGICGDPWDGPRENEVGGKYAQGIIVRKYERGSIINVTVQITANHKGYFEFRLCAKDNPNQEATQKCLDDNILQVVESGTTKFNIKDERWNVDFSLHVHLPSDVTCISCVLQWKYNTGNSWGTDPDGKSCIGCGPQEQFYGCSDIAIGHAEVKIGVPYVTVNPNDGNNKDNKIDNGNDKTEGCNCPCNKLSNFGTRLFISKSIFLTFFHVFYLRL